MKRHQLIHKKAKIYTLCNPNTGEIFYVGRTTRHLRDRIGGHLCIDNKSTNKKYKDMLQRLKSENITPVIEEVERCSYDDSLQLEKYWIHQFNAWGFNLVNEFLLKRNKPRKIKTLYKCYLSIKERYAISTLYKRGDNKKIADSIGVSQELIRIYMFKKIIPEYIKDAILNYYKLIAA